MCKKSGFVIFVFSHCEKTISNDDHVLISPPKNANRKHKFVILNTHIIVFKHWLCVLLQCKALELGRHLRETRKDSNEMRRVSRETRHVSREGGNLHLSGTVVSISKPI